MIILGIDTSCDDTAISLMEITDSKSQIPNFRILSNVVSSQTKLHQKYGGVYPFLAKREHQRNLPVVFKKVLGQAQGKRFDLIGVTAGPGLEPCLWQGINFAQDLAKRFKKPLIPVNHIEAHILANFVGENSKFEIRNSKLFPAVCLVVSGGHTQLILMKDIGQYQLIGETRDDAAGECFDKTARILGLGYPGGPAIVAAAAQRNLVSSETKFLIRLPRPMISQKNYDFSFSGLKTAVLYNYRSQSAATRKSKEYIRGMSFEIQQAIIDVLIRKTLKAAKDYRVKSIMLGGGVAANDELRQQFKNKIKKEIPAARFYIPDSKLCTDNAAMIAVTAYFHLSEIKRDIKANANLRI